MTRSEAMESILLMHERKNRGNYREAFQLAMSIEEKYIRSTYDMIAVADICIQNKKYEEALKWLVEVREKSSSKRILVQLIYVCLKLDRLDEARYYYDIYLQGDPDSTDRYVLEYRLRKREGVEYGELVGILKKINESTFSERWAFELAKMYHKMGDFDSCIRECERIVLWFGNGPIVEKAKMLRDYHNGVLESERPAVRTADIPSVKAEETSVEAESQPEPVAGEPAAESADVPEQTEDLEAGEVTGEETASETAEEQEAVNGQEEAVEETAGEAEVPAEDAPEVQKPAPEPETAPEPPKRVALVPRGRIFRGVELYSCFHEYTDNRLLMNQLETMCDMVETDESMLRFRVEGESEKAKAFAMDFLKFMRATKVIPFARVAKISASKLNSISLEKQYKALTEAVLMVTEAESLSSKSHDEIGTACEVLGSSLAVILTGTEEGRYNPEDGYCFRV